MSVYTVMCGGVTCTTAEEVCTRACDWTPACAPACTPHTVTCAKGAL